MCLALLLSASLCVSSVGAAAIPSEIQIKANTLLLAVEDKNVKEQIQVSEVMENLSLLEEKYLLDEDVALVGVSEDGNAIYVQSIPGDDSALAYLEVWQGDDGSNYVRITEGDLENIVRYTPDGKTYIDGYDATDPVVTPDGMDISFITGLSSTVEPQAGGNLVSSFWKNPMYGSTFSEYNNGSQSLYSSTVAVKFGEAVLNLTITIVKSKIEAALPGYPGKIGSDIFDHVVNGMYNNMKSKHPDSKAISFKDYRRAHPSNSTQMMMYRHDVWYYTGEYYTGTAEIARYYYEVRVPT